MTTKVSWGNKLEPHELDNERRIWQEQAQRLTDMINAALANTDLRVIDYRTTNRDCVHCPERPHECHLCRVDAACAEFLRPQAAQLTIAIVEEMVIVE